jgi:hypothetical protein
MKNKKLRMMSLILAMTPNRYSAKAGFGLRRECQFSGFVSSDYNEIGCAENAGGRFGLSREAN